MSETDGVPGAEDVLPFVWRGVRIDSTVEARAGRLEPGWWLLGWTPPDVDPDAEPGSAGAALSPADAVVALPVLIALDLLAAEGRLGVDVSTRQRVVAELETAMILHRLSGLRPLN